MIQEEKVAGIRANYVQSVLTKSEHTYCLQGNGIDRADTAGCNGRGWCEDVSYTLNTIDRPAVVAAFSPTNSARARSIGYREEQSPALKAEVNGNNPPTVICMATQQGGAEIRTDDKAPTLTAAAGMSGNNQPVVYDARGNGDGKTVCTITGDHENRITDYTAIAVEKRKEYVPEIAHSLRSKSACAFREDTETYVATAAVDCRSGTENPDINGTLQAKPNGGYSINYQNTERVGSIVRRLTPLECDRLQGYPDNWTEIGVWTDTKGKTHETSDANRYKADGNSIALPFWFWLLRRISAQYERPATLGSLFDGIGGFPLCWERCNGKGAARWASEIEEFPIAVTKFRFGEE